MDVLAGMSLFTNVVDLGSFRAAAERLGLSPSAVSKQVARLEDRLGARLLNRTTRSLGLTEAGTMYYDHCTRILAEVDEAEQQVAETTHVPRGLLRVSMPTSFGQFHLASALPLFCDRYPELRVTAVAEDREVDLIHEGFDVAVRISNLRDSTMIARRLTSNRRIVCATPEFFERHAIPRVPQDLSGLNCIINRVFSPQHTWSFHKQDKHESVHVSGNLVFDSSQNIYRAAFQGTGIVLLPAYLVYEDLRQGRLMAVLKDYVSEDPAVYVVYPPARQQSLKVRVFVDFLIEHFKTLRRTGGPSVPSGPREEA